MRPPSTVRWSLALLSLSALLSACGGDSSSGAPDTGTAVPDVPTDNGNDLGAADSGIDVPPIDVPTPDDTSPVDTSPADAMDVPAGDTGPRGCTSAADCAGDPGGPACDTATGRCVACVTDEHCSAGALCAGNVCVMGCTSARPCPAGQTCCDGACVDPQANLAHCGGCGTRCMVVNGVGQCMNGQCAIGQCNSPFASCDGMAANGCETNTQSDAAHCGGCAMACAARANASARCASGRCEYACNMGFADCDNDPANGCETDTRASATHCGGCGMRCSLANATAGCTDGRCAVATCAMNFGDCDTNALNGCESDLRTTVAHCGRCGVSCPGGPNAIPACANGSCAYICTAAYSDCDGNVANGCEVDTRSNAMHCGGCGRSCVATNGVAQCVGSVCGVTSCAMNFGNCDGNPANGCETDLRVSPTNCGACGRAAMAETCNGIDDDCDGFVDEGVPGTRSNLPADLGVVPTAGLRPAGSVVMNTDTGEITGVRAAGEGLVSGIGFRRVIQTNGPTLGVFVVTEVTVAAGLTVSAMGNNALAIVAQGVCAVDGAIDVSGAAGTNGGTETSARPGGVGRAGGANGGNGSGG